MVKNAKKTAYELHNTARKAFSSTFYSSGRISGALVDKNQSCSKLLLPSIHLKQDIEIVNELTDSDKVFEDKEYMHYRGRGL